MARRKSEAEARKRVPVDNRAQELALAIWAGQSTSLPRAERIRRIERALTDQGLATEVDLPHE